MKNAYRARVPVEIGGQTLLFEFDYDALAAIRTQIGDDKAMAAVLDLQRGVDIDHLCALIAIGLHLNHPDWTSERVRKARAPVHATVVALNEALSALYFGPSGPPEAQPPNPLTRILRWLMGRRIRSGAITG